MLVVGGGSFSGAGKSKETTQSGLSAVDTGSERASVDGKLHESTGKLKNSHGFAVGIAGTEQFGKHLLHELGSAGIASHAAAAELFLERPAQPLLLPEEEWCQQWD